MSDAALDLSTEPEGFISAADLLAGLAGSAVEAQRLFDRAYLLELNQLERDSLPGGGIVPLAPAHQVLQSMEFTFSVLMRTTSEKTFKISAMPINAWFAVTHQMGHEKLCRLTIAVERAPARR